jgi:uncharacterized protein (DUF433 family)
METRTLGRYIVADPAICHGEPTFRGTRSRVADVLEHVESGMTWAAIIKEWRYALTRDAIAERLFAWHVRCWSLMHPDYVNRKVSY